MRRVVKGDYDKKLLTDSYEKLDAEIFGICQKAEKLCKQDWAGKSAWSPKLAAAIKHISYWRYRLRHKERMLISRNYEQELSIKYVNLLKATIHLMINKWRGKLTNIQQEAKKHRQDHLEALAQNYANQHNLTQQRA